MAPSRHTYESTTRLIDMVIEHAFARFARYGYSKTTVDEIAADAKISKRTLYIVFPSKEAILHEGVWREVNPALENFKGALPADVFTNPKQLLLELLRYMFRDLLDHGAHSQFHGLLSEDADMQSAWRKAVKRVYRDILHEGIACGTCKPVDCDLASETLSHLTHTIVNHIRTASHPEETMNHALSFINDSILQS